MKKDLFRVFGSEELGRLFLPDGFSYENTQAYRISPFHGRAVALKESDYRWISVKGGGWNYGGPQVYLSNKDEELIFGLYPLESAERELSVSRAIETFSDAFPKVLYYKNLCDYVLPKPFVDVSTATFRNGKQVKPCLLYTQLRCPVRVADLMYFTEEERKEAVASCCRYWNVPSEEYTEKFTERLASHVALMHKNGCINDTLDYGNVTLLAEVVDYEWVTVPNIRLPDGTFGLEITEERREKEILYGAEVCLQLRAMLWQDCNLFEVYREFVSAYATVNREFTEKNERIQKFLRKEEFIL